MSMQSGGYANPDVLVGTTWVADHLRRPGVRLLAVGAAAGGDSRQIPGALALDPRQRLDGDGFAALCSRLGIAPATTVVFYDGDDGAAAHGYFVFKLYRHRDCRVVNGGRSKWAAEGRPLAALPARVEATTYPVPAVDETILARGGRAWPIPSIDLVNPDCTYKSALELRRLVAALGFQPSRRVTVGSCLIWFVLRELLGFPNVRACPSPTLEGEEDEEAAAPARARAAGDRRRSLALRAPVDVVRPG
jgi:thiosulfate/3-mercaptopyruvate sulfurtransferase